MGYGTLMVRGFAALQRSGEAVAGHCLFGDPAVHAGDTSQAGLRLGRAPEPLSPAELQR